MRKAFIGALVALFIIGALLFLARSTLADTTGRNIIVLCDLTQSVSIDNFQSNINAVSKLVYKLEPKDRLVVLEITDEFGNPAVLLDDMMPAKDGYLSLDLQAAREQISGEWKKISKGLFDQRIYKRTDLLGSLFLLQYLDGLPPGDTFIVVFSDLRQCTIEFDLESMSQISPTKEIERLKRSNNIPDLTGYKIYLLGVDPKEKSRRYFESLKDFWIDFFNEAGADVRVFTIDRRLPAF